VKKNLGLAVSVVVVALLLVWLYVREAPPDEPGGDAAESDVSQSPAPRTRSAVDHQAQDASHRQSRPTSAELVGVPSNLQFAGVSTIQSADSFADWMAKFNPDQRRIIDDFNRKFPGVYEVTSRAQIAWMAQKGYLMPEDVLAASGMTESELKTLADQGNIKAKLLYSQRVQTRFNTAQQAFVEAGGRAADFSESADGRAIFQELMGSSRAATSNVENPFVGYQIAWQSLSLPDPEHISAGVLRGLMQAEMAGDVRVTTQLLEEYRQAGILTSEQISAALSAYSGVQNYLGTLPVECRKRLMIPDVL
jgi:hypothetical protein